MVLPLLNLCLWKELELNHENGNEKSYYSICQMIIAFGKRKKRKARKRGKRGKKRKGKRKKEIVNCFLLLFLF